MSGNQAICLGALHAGPRLLRRLSDHARVRHPRVAGRAPAALRRRRDPDRGRDRRAGVGAGRVVCGPQGDDRDLGPGPVADGRAGRPRRHGRDSRRDRGRAALRPVDRDADEDGAVRPQPRSVRRPRRVAARRDGADFGRGLLRRDRRGVQRRREVPGAGDRAVGPVALAPAGDRRAARRSSRTRSTERVSPNGSAETNGSYKRYEIRADGVSPMAVPGGPGAYVSTGIEHDEAGNPHYEPELHTAMMSKRFRKLAAARRPRGARDHHRSRAGRRRHPGLGVDRGRGARGGRDLPRPRASRCRRATRACSRRCRPSASASGRRAWTA